MPRAWLPGTHNFSFSGLKTAVLYAVQQIAGAETVRKLDPAVDLAPDTVADLAASFQQAVVDVLVEKTLQAASAMNACEICVCGGVSANVPLRQTM